MTVEEIKNSILEVRIWVKDLISGLKNKFSLVIPPLELFQKELVFLTIKYNVIIFINFS